MLTDATESPGTDMGAAGICEGGGGRLSVPFSTNTSPRHPERQADGPAAADNFEREGSAGPDGGGFCSPAVSNASPTSSALASGLVAVSGSVKAAAAGDHQQPSSRAGPAATSGDQLLGGPCAENSGDSGPATPGVGLQTQSCGQRRPPPPQATTDQSMSSTSMSSTSGFPCRALTPSSVVESALSGSFAHGWCWDNLKSAGTQNTVPEGRDAKPVLLLGGMVGLSKTRPRNMRTTSSDDDFTKCREANKSLAALDLRPTLGHKRGASSLTQLTIKRHLESLRDSNGLKETPAATKLQATFRGFLLRKKLIASYEDHIAALEDRLRTTDTGVLNVGLLSSRSRDGGKAATTGQLAALNIDSSEPALARERERAFAAEREKERFRIKLEECQEALSKANWRVQDLSQELERTKENCAQLHSSLTQANQSSKEMSAHLAMASRALEAQTNRSATLSATLASLRQSVPADHQLSAQLESMEPHLQLAATHRELETERARCILKTGECDELRAQVIRLKGELELEKGCNSAGSTTISSLRDRDALSDGGAGGGGGRSWNSSSQRNAVNQIIGGKSASGGYRNSGERDGRVTPTSASSNSSSGVSRRLSTNNAKDKSSTPDWKVFVEKIVKTNDQQASLFLQQRLKTATADMRQAILDAVLPHSLALMKNKFGNFLMQRCFEYGTRMQTSAMAATMRGNVLSLALDPFGCHVAQKALDNVDEDVKASIVSEMLVRRIPETIIHRFASHVWQRIFEIRWTGAAGAPAVMNYVQNALQGAWHQVAVEENGSLVVQNIFENCSEPEKRPVLREVLDHAPMIARGEFGNWVIQHILEHGAPPDRRRIIQIILDDLPKIATDQYSSKVVEKALKTATRNEVQEIADKLCRTESPSVSSYLNSPTSSELDASASTVGNYYNSGMSGLMMDHPGIATSGPLAYHSDPVAAAAICLPAILALVADQYGNYVVQHLFHVAPSEQRDRVASHIRPYLPALRASKYGQKVAQIVERMSRPGGRSGAHSGGGCGGASGAGGAPGGGGAHHYHQHHHTANNGNPAAVAAAAAAAAAALQHPQQHQLNALFHANVIASYSAGPWGRW